jgi:hypothetical protein
MSNEIPSPRGCHARSPRMPPSASIAGLTDKRGGERGEWHYAAEDRGQYLDGLVLDFSEAYARRVERLEPIAAAVAERWELELEPAPVKA